MGRYVTPAGVVIEMSDAAAAAVGYKAEAVEKSPAAEQPKRKPGRPKKSD